MDEPRTYYTEWSESEGDKYHILTHIYCNLEKCYRRISLYSCNNGETDIETWPMDIGRGEERVRHIERVTWKLTLPKKKQKLTLPYTECWQFDLCFLCLF